MIDFLPLLHLSDAFDTDAGVRPENVPIVVVVHFAKVEQLGRASHAIVFTQRQADEVNPSASVQKTAVND